MHSDIIGSLKINIMPLRPVVIDRRFHFKFSHFSNLSQILDNDNSCELYFSFQKRLSYTHLSLLQQ